MVAPEAPLVQQRQRCAFSLCLSQIRPTSVQHIPVGYSQPRVLVNSVHTLCRALTLCVSLNSLKLQYYRGRHGTRSQLCGCPVVQTWSATQADKLCRLCVGRQTVVRKQPLTSCCISGTGNAHLVRNSVDGSLEVLVFVVSLAPESLDAELFLLADLSFQQSYPHTRFGIAEQGRRHTVSKLAAVGGLIHLQFIHTCSGDLNFEQHDPWCTAVSCPSMLVDKV